MGSYEVYVDMKKMGYLQREVAHWKKSKCVTGDFGALAALAIPFLGAAILLYAWPHKTLRQSSPLRRCLSMTDHGRTRALAAVGELERTV
jgi:hypothetical protein